MNPRLAVLLACVVIVPSFAGEPAKNAAPPGKTVVATLPASAAVLTAPLGLKDGAIGQPEQTELPAGGKAVFAFTVAKAGAYVVHAVVNAPGEDANSFYVNIDADPKDPLMVWDFDVTNGFEERTVSWRGNGSPEKDEIAPKVFQLTAGAHRLIVVGREPAQLKSVAIVAGSN